jgi:hypothetical protein
MRKKVDYNGLLFKSANAPNVRLLIGVPMTGLVRSEWCMARYGQVIPCNWSQSECVMWMNSMVPLGYAVAEARNMIVDEVVKKDYEWLLFIDHDTMPPPDAFVTINQYMIDGSIPVVCGLYYAKCHPPEPLIFRGRGNGTFNKFTIGQKVWCDGIPMGFTLINAKLLRVMHKDAPPYKIGDRTVKQVFDTPAGVRQLAKGGYAMFHGTEDLAWCKRVMEGGYFTKAGFPKFAKKEYPFLVDTNIFCKHISPDGKVYPIGEPNRKKVTRHA